MKNKHQSSRGRRGCLWWAGRLLLGLAGLFVLTALVGAGIRANLRSKYPPVGQMVDAGGYQMHLYCQGDGNPTVILEAGQGNMGLIWAPVQSEVSRSTRVCFYDRAGLGWSHLARKPRSAEVVVEELRTVLARAGVPGPYVLVGHSVGGLFVRLFAATYPQEVVGMVLVDSVHEDRFVRSPEKEIETLRQVVKVMPYFYGIQKALAYTGIPAILPTRADDHLQVSNETVAMYQAVQKSNLRYITGISTEIAALENYYSQVRSANITTLGDIPLVVLSHGQPTPYMGMTEAESQAAEQVWQQFQAELASQSSNGKLIIAEQSSHDIHLQQPELVIAAIQEVVAAVQQD